MENLSNDCLYLIFKQLTPKEWLRLNLVCKRWRHLSMYLWSKSISIGYFRYTEDPDEYKSLSHEEATSILKSIGPILQELTLEYEFWSKKIRFTIGPYIYKVDHDFDQQYVMKILAPFFPNISSLNLKEIKFNFPVIKTKGYKKFFSGLRELSYTFTSTYHHDILEVNEILQKVFRAATQLRKLNLELKFFHQFRTEPWKNLTNLVHLEHLEMSGTRIKIPYKILRGITTNCNKLRVIKMESAIVSIKGLQEILSLPNLEVLHLLKVADMPKVVKPLRELRDLSISFPLNKDINLEKLCNAVENMPALCNLDISGLSDDMSLNFTYKVICIAMKQSKIPIVYDKLSKKKMVKIYDHNIGVPCSRTDTIYPTLKICVASQTDMYLLKVKMFARKTLPKSTVLRIDNDNII